MTTLEHNYQVGDRVWFEVSDCQARRMDLSDNLHGLDRWLEGEIIEDSLDEIAVKVTASGIIPQEYAGDWFFSTQMQIDRIIPAYSEGDVVRNIRSGTEHKVLDVDWYPPVNRRDVQVTPKCGIFAFLSESFLMDHMEPVAVANVAAYRAQEAPPKAPEPPSWPTWRFSATRSQAASFRLFEAECVAKVRREICRNYREWPSSGGEPMALDLSKSSQTMREVVIRLMPKTVDK